MKIYGDSRSTNTRKVLTTLAELDAAYELVHVDFALGAHKQQPHLARQPFGQMPALEDDGFVLYETHAMCRYINDRASGQLMPRELRARAVADQWMSIESANFAGHAMKFVYHYLLRAPQEPAALEHAAAAFDRTLEILAAQLSWHPFVAGQAFTLADICFMPYFEYALLTPAKDLITRHPSVVAWWDKVSERQSWQKVAAHA